MRSLFGQLCVETGFLVRTENMPDSLESRAYYQTETLKKL